MIVNVDIIVRLKTLSHGEFTVILKSGDRVRVGRNYRGAIGKLFGEKFDHSQDWIAEGSNAVLDYSQAGNCTKFLKEPV